MKKNSVGIGNKGFSLVELIIVIAIMAILVGIMAPQLLKWIEKSKVTSDTEMLSSLYDGIVFAISDPSVFEDAQSMAFINSTMVTKTRLEDIPSGSKLEQELLNTIGWHSGDLANYQSKISSTHGGGSTIYFMYKGGAFNPVAMWISETDSTGGKDVSEDPGTYTDIVKCISIK